MSKFMCVCNHLCVCTPIQIYIIYTIFVLSFKIKRYFLIKCQRLTISSVTEIFSISRAKIISIPWSQINLNSQFSLSNWTNENGTVGGCCFFFFEGESSVFFPLLRSLLPIHTLPFPYLATSWLTVLTGRASWGKNRSENEERFWLGY